jgi:hypothetical protein
MSLFRVVAEDSFFSFWGLTMRLLVSGICAALVVTMVSTANFQAGEKEKPKLNIKQVMKQAHAGQAKSLLAKVATGKASDEEKAKLVALYVSLSQNEPPKGDVEDWKERTSNLVNLAKAAQKGDEGAGEKLMKAAACMVCHTAHKGK